MFTGIVRGIGRVAIGGPGRLGIDHPRTAAGTALGASVAVNGACLTVVEIKGQIFIADVIPETLSRTNLGRLRPGDPVNLEPSLTAEQFLDGHLVQGHVDAVAEVIGVDEVELGLEVTIRTPQGLARYIAEKGSIAVDGASLTVARQSDQKGTFTVALIPHTIAQTIAGTYRPGSQVNLEVDVVARYLERLVRGRTQPGI
jgi:riboflavin synthase